MSPALNQTAAPLPTDPDALLTTQMLADKLHMSPRTLEGWRVTGYGPPFIKVGPNKIGYLWSSAQAWLLARQVNSTSEETAA